VRSEVARQVGSLIWEARSGPEGESVTIRRRALAAILPLVEEAITGGGADAERLEGLREALSTFARRCPEPRQRAWKAATETRNETKS
jgi:hypothetical protein